VAATPPPYGALKRSRCAVRSLRYQRVAATPPPYGALKHYALIVAECEFPVAATPPPYGALKQEQPALLVIYTWWRQRHRPTGH